ncbi:nucleoside diphosphate kinase, mitochondrial [Cynoglossus semilaevis]|uniref:Nucleoside diphosphate kinase n=1 Tax=Cynoglossus semilaevis TaxID=244447 RepID=A0A3P8WA41_CYNSE|nr:uncharacterized protein LOC103392972 [Cynoglossus semilaevis]
MIMLQRCIFKKFIQAVHSRHQDTTKGLLSVFPTSLLNGPTAAGQRNTSSAPDLTEQTLIAVKPDGVQRRLVGKIIQRFEQRGFKLVGLKMMRVSDDLLAQHYCELRAKPFYPSVLQYMTSGPVVVMVWEGHNVVQTSRSMVGLTNPVDASPGTVRGDYGTHVSRNVVHASDSLEGAQREIKLWFQGEDLVTWECCDRTSLCEP